MSKRQNLINVIVYIKKKTKKNRSVRQITRLHFLKGKGTFNVNVSKMSTSIRFDTYIYL